MKLQFIKEQINWVNNWTKNLITNIDESQFGVVDSLGTSINWQIGHLLVSNYFHSIHSILPSEHIIVQSINSKIPMDVYFKNYFAGSNPKAEWTERPNKEILLVLFSEINNATNAALEIVTDTDLEEQTEIKNPIAKTKYDALTFTFKHQMWHNGQIAMLKRIMLQS